MSRSSRRNFNQRLGQLLLSAAVPPAAINNAKLNLGIELFPKIILINKFLAEVDPEI
jgi:hypothetical protein